MTPIEARERSIDMIHQAVCVDRVNTHGDAVINLKRIAELWSWWLKARGIMPGYPANDITALDVAEMMNLLKTARKASNPTIVDHWTDGAGYNVLGAGMLLQSNESNKESPLAS